MMNKICIAFFLVLFVSCKQTKTEQKELSKINEEVYLSRDWNKIFKTDTIIASETYWKKIIEKDSLENEFKATIVNSFPLKDKTLTFQWKDKHGILINKDYCKTVSEPERAAIGYLALLYNSSSHYDTALNESCTIESALKLGEQCSEEYKYFMQFWFRNDAKTLKKINNCYLVPDTSSSFDYFSQIKLKIKGNKIYIYFNAKGFSRDIWDSTWTGTIIFLVDKYNIKLIKSKISNARYTYYYPNCSDIGPPPGYKNNGNGEYRLPQKKK